MTTYKRRGQTGVVAEQFNKPRLALPKGISALWFYTDIGVFTEIEDKSWIVTSVDPSVPNEILSDRKFNDEFEAE